MLTKLLLYITLEHYCHIQQLKKVATKLPPFVVLSTFFFLWIKTANGCSFMASQEYCKRWRFYGHFSEFVSYVSTKLQTLAVLWPLFGVYRMLSPPELQTLAVLWPLFRVYIKVAIKLLTMTVLWPQHSKSSFHHKTANPMSSMATFRCM